MRVQDFLFYIALQLSLILLGLYGLYSNWSIGSSGLFTAEESLQPLFFLARLGFCFSVYLFLNSGLNLVRLLEKL